MALCMMIIFGVVCHGSDFVCFLLMGTVCLAQCVVMD